MTTDPSRPTALSDTQLPAALQTYDQWVCWRTTTRDGTPTKIPINPATGTYASVTDPETWADYETAHDYATHEDVDGLGFVFTTDDPYTGIDLDDARDPDTETIDEWVLDVILRLDSYTELSPSGTGYHILVEGSVPAGGNRTGKLEIYDHGRYFTMTGAHVTGTPDTIEPRTDALHAIHKEYIAQPETSDEEPPTPTPVEATDKELIEKAMTAANGDKFRRLWLGDTTGYDSHSEADQALCNLLAFWTGGDQPRMERLFEKSGLVREKWIDRADYRERTIHKAVRDCPAFYPNNRQD